MDCSFFLSLLMSTLNMHEVDIKALLCRCCESLSTDDKGRWFCRFIELQRQDSMIQPEFLHSNSSGFTHSPLHEPSSSAHRGNSTKDLPPAEVAGSSRMGPHSWLAQPRKEKKGKSLQFCVVLQGHLNSASLKFGSVTTGAGAASP